MHRAFGIFVLLPNPIIDPEFFIMCQLEREMRQRKTGKRERGIIPVHSFNEKSKKIQKEGKEEQGEEEEEEEEKKKKKKKEKEKKKKKRKRNKNKRKGGSKRKKLLRKVVMVMHF